MCSRLFYLMVGMGEGFGLIQDRMRARFDTNVCLILLGLDVLCESERGRGLVLGSCALRVFLSYEDGHE